MRPTLKSIFPTALTGYMSKVIDAVTPARIAPSRVTAKSEMTTPVPTDHTREIVRGRLANPIFYPVPRNIPDIAIRTMLNTVAYPNKAFFAGTIGASFLGFGGMSYLVDVTLAALILPSIIQMCGGLYMGTSFHSPKVSRNVRELCSDTPESDKIRDQFLKNKQQFFRYRDIIMHELQSKINEDSQTSKITPLPPYGNVLEVLARSGDPKAVSFLVSLTEQSFKIIHEAPHRNTSIYFIFLLENLIQALRVAVDGKPVPKEVQLVLQRYSESALEILHESESVLAVGSAKYIASRAANQSNIPEVWK